MFEVLKGKFATVRVYGLKKQRLNIESKIIASAKPENVTKAVESVMNNEGFSEKEKNKILNNSLTKTKTNNIIKKIKKEDCSYNSERINIIKNNIENLNNIVEDKSNSEEINNETDFREIIEGEVATETYSEDEEVVIEPYDKDEEESLADTLFDEEDLLESEESLEDYHEELQKNKVTEENSSSTNHNKNTGARFCNIKALKAFLNDKGENIFTSKDIDSLLNKRELKKNGIIYLLPSVHELLIKRKDQKDELVKFNNLGVLN